MIQASRALKRRVIITRKRAIHVLYNARDTLRSKKKKKFAQQKSSICDKNFYDEKSAKICETPVARATNEKNAIAKTNEKFPR